MVERKIWTDMRISMNLKKKRGGLNEWKIWTDIGISMNLKKKRWGFGQTEDYKNKKKTKKKQLSPDLSESLTRFTIMMAKYLILVLHTLQKNCW